MISRFIYVNIKRYLKNPTMISMVVALPIIVAIGMNFLLTSEQGLKIITIDNDKTKVSEEFLEDLSQEFDIEVITKKEFENPDFESGSAGILMTLDKGYGEAISKGELPSVKIKELKESQNNKFLAMEIDSAIKLDAQNEKFSEYTGSSIKAEVVQKDKLKMGLIIGLLISYYIFIGSTVITTDILEMKNNNILKRAISTANKNYKIMVGLFVGSFIFLALSGVISFVGSKKISKLLDDVSMLNGIVAMLLISLFSISLTVFFVRWFKNKDII
ncbi:ABC transporter permease, partial [uncultured Clostridium sp.]|uniref:ABC transporter permease n=1 Tax=uncultured Clostridium sp. TaxID=59620 RepID=UPI0026265A5F